MKDYKKYKKAKKENNIAKTGQVAGAATAGIGTGAYLLSKAVDKTVEKTKGLTQEDLIKAIRDAESKGKVAERMSKAGIENSARLKKVGKVAIPVGAALLVGSTVIKKKSDKKLKELKEDDSSKKKE